MNWIERMNQVMDYVEEHLCDEMDHARISRIALCPTATFLRVFALTAGVSLSEYIRRRRLTRAAYELQTTKDKVVDIAVKYGYESADAFGVAFKRLHGVMPSAARRLDTRLKAYPRISFTLIMKGVVEMEYRVVERESFPVIGIRRVTPYGGGTWGIIKADGTIHALSALRGAPCNLGLCFGFDQEGNNDYMCAIEYESENAPAGFDRYVFPDSTWLVFEARGTISGGALGDAWKRIYGEFLPQSAYVQSDLPTMEDYREWDEKADLCRVDIWIPVGAEAGRTGPSDQAV